MTRTGFGRGPGEGPGAVRFFHVHRRALAKYGLGAPFFGIRGDVLFTNHYQAHVFLETLRKERGGDFSLRASELYGMGLVHEVFHAVISLYRSEVKPSIFASMLESLRAKLGGEVDRTLRTFVACFPPPAVHGQGRSIDEFLHTVTEGVPNEEWMLEEVLLLWLSNRNPAYAPIRDLVSDEDMRRETAYLAVLEAIETLFRAEAPFGPDGTSLVDMLLAPIRHSPTSIAGQLEYIRDRWGVTLMRHGSWLRVVGGLDFIGEEGRWFWRRSHGAPGEAVPPTFRGDLYELEPERFTEDLDWMPRVVMIAKSTFVWLDQLSAKYQRPIRALSEIPDDELSLLAARGFTALWLIGVWRRSEASRRIKHIQGNADAIASAYSIHDYEIAPELGGEEALQDLKERAQRLGIRLASDMVPNHMGIDSVWVLHHPERFLQADHPAYPGYRYSGSDLSSDGRVGIYIEDGYWSRTDAAVVFKRIDRSSGEIRYIYHGNDGTSMPWNDTAQLDYSRHDVREAVIQTILQVARKFPILRFDAAMTLAKKHYQRLWFPLPGTGGSIPSRAEYAMSKERFDELFPSEFWREVVDRVTAEIPNTLLLAEAFWLMEGYFVRTLGMHRVYNSAFMNMLKREDNASYRLSIRNVLEFNPQILKRHVNFMNNPDEEPAVLQFGKGDKYIGVCILMATMPGLPMFGHGQIEGFGEKYGMEFSRAAWREEPDPWLVERHEREIFPLLRKRHLFSDVDSFLLYDFVTPEGHVDEDVFAYSNRHRGERSLVVVHNRYKETRGSIRRSVGFAEPSGKLIHRSLAEGWELHRNDAYYTIFRDHLTGLERIRKSRELTDNGMYLELHAYEAHVFWEVREVVHTSEKPYGDLERELAGRGVPSIEDALVEHTFQAIHRSYYEAINPGSLRYLLSGAPDHESARRTFMEKLQHITEGVRYVGGPLSLPENFLESRERRFLSFVAADDERLHAEREASALRASATFTLGELFLIWLFTESLRSMREIIGPAESGGFVVRDWHLGRILERSLREAGNNEIDSRHGASLIALLVRARDRLGAGASRDEVAPAGSRHVGPIDARELSTLLGDLAEDDDVRAFLEVHTHGGVLWFRKERFEELALGACAIASFERIFGDRTRPTSQAAMSGGGIEALPALAGPLVAAIREVFALGASSGYRFLELRELLGARSRKPA